MSLAWMVLLKPSPLPSHPRGGSRVDVVLLATLLPLVLEFLNPSPMFWLHHTECSTSTTPRAPQIYLAPTSRSGFLTPNPPGLGTALTLAHLLLP
jgi:hypothetical protein